MHYSNGKFFESWRDMALELLTAEEKENIEQKAREFLIKNNAAKMPIDPETLALREGLSVKYASIPGNTIGKLNRGDKVIIVDDWLKSEPSYARCVIAHELGHWYLEPSDNADMASNTQSEKKELEASLFARALLMPKPYVEKAVEIYNAKRRQEFDSLTDYITSLFKVTDRKARLRLGELGFG